MHNQHVIVCTANSHDAANSFVSSTLAEWGTDNNWFSIDATLCVKDGSLQKEESQKNETFSVRDVNKQINGILNSEGVDGYNETAIDALNYTINIYNKKTYDKGDYFNFYAASKMFMAISQKLQAKKCMKGKKFDALKDGFKDGVYDEFGVTHLANQDKGQSKYVIFIDMHS